MKKILIFLFIATLIVSLVSCDAFSGLIGSTTTTQSNTLPSSTTTLPSTSTSSTTRPRQTTTSTTTTTTTVKPEPSGHLYDEFTDSEREMIYEMTGATIPFLPNDEYYVEAYTFDYDSGETEMGVNFYTYGNTKAEYEDYRDLYADWELVDSYDDEYGDTWYSYDSGRGYLVDLSHYETSDGYVMDLYVYIIKTSSSGGNEGGNTGNSYKYTDFTADEKALFDRYIGAQIPFVPNDEYYIEGYYDIDDYEHGINFYTIGNTQADFNAYRAEFSTWELYETYEDDYGDTWYCYIKGDVVVDVAFYYYDSSYFIDLYVYSDLSTDIEDDGNEGGSTGGNEGGSSSSDADVITNEGAGLPADSDGVFDVDFTKAENVKDVTDQGYYIDGCPATGSPAVLVIPVEFKDSLASSKGYTTDALAEAFGKDGKTEYYSVYDYYNISSYGKLTLDITVLDDWFCPEYDSTYYYNATYDYYGDEVAIGDQLVLDEALAYLEGKMDLSQFDSDDNGIIDAVVLINTLDVGEEDFYWAYRYWNIYTDDEGYYYEYDGVSANDYLWASYQFLYESYDEEGNAIYSDTTVMNNYTYIHEFGHVLGLDDYYDTSYEGAPLDGCDIMDSMCGDHNAFSKFNLGWLTQSRLVVTDTSVTLTLEDFSKNGDTIILANNWDEKLGAYQEYYILVYYTNNGLNSGDNGYFARDGVVVYHVNASLYREEIDGETYYDVYNNNTDASDPNGYGTEDNLIEFVKSGEDTFTYVVGSTFTNVTDDNGDVLGYTFTIDSLTSDSATITFTAQ